MTIVIAAMIDDERQPALADVEALPEHRIEPGDEEHAGHDHRRAVQQRRHGRRPGHRVGQPGVQRELARLADAGDEQGDRADQQDRARRFARQRPGLDGRDVEAVAVEVVLRPLVGAEEDDDRADEQADVADAHGEERLQRRSGVGLLLPPVPDQHERAQAHDLPAEDDLDHVLGENHDEHARREQGDGGEEVGVPAIAADVVEAVDLDEQRDERHGPEQHHRQAVDPRADGELEAVARPPDPACARPARRTVRRRALRPPVGTMALAMPLHEAGGFLTVAASAEFVRWIHWIAVPVASTSDDGHRGDADLGPLERHPLADADDQRERDRRGSRAISQAFSRNHPELSSVLLAASMSALHLGQFVERDGTAVAVDHEHHRQADADFGCRDRDHVEGEHLAVGRCRASARRR